MLMLGVKGASENDFNKQSTTLNIKHLYSLHKHRKHFKTLCIIRTDTDIDELSSISKAKPAKNSTELLSI